MGASRPRSHAVSVRGWLHPILLSTLALQVLPGQGQGSLLARGRRAQAYDLGNETNQTNATNATCLCVFDIDRTLTGKQGDVSQCPDNTIIGLYDEGYGGGVATLSALASANFSTTFCNECYLGITSAGAGSGEGTPWNNYLFDSVMRSQMQDPFMEANPSYKHWSYGTSVTSPYVLQQGNKIKQEAVELIRQWYNHPLRNVTIEAEDVYFFGDRTENIVPFAEKGINSREISCGSRDPWLYAGTGMVGYCGARPEEILKMKGNFLCA